MRPGKTPLGLLGRKMRTMLAGNDSPCVSQKYEGISGFSSLASHTSSQHMRRHSLEGHWADSGGCLQLYPPRPNSLLMWPFAHNTFVPFKILQIIIAFRKRNVSQAPRGQQTVLYTLIPQVTLGVGTAARTFSEHGKRGLEPGQLASEDTCSLFPRLLVRGRPLTRSQGLNNRYRQLWLPHTISPSPPPE